MLNKTDLFYIIIYEYKRQTDIASKRLNQPGGPFSKKNLFFSFGQELQVNLWFGYDL